MYLLGIETGTRGTRAVALDLERARLVAESNAEHPLVEGLPEGHREQDPATWISAVDRTVRQVLDALGEERGKVVAMAVSGEPNALVALDGENRIIRSAKMGGDLSARRQAEEMSRAFGGTPGIFELTGVPLRPEFLASKLLWLKQHEPYHFQRLATVLQPHDFINYWLTGVKRMEAAGASMTGLLEIGERQWCRELLEFIDPRLEEILPPVRSSREVHGPLRPELANLWGLSAEVIVAPGGPEPAMRALGAGGVIAGMATLDLGARLELGAVADRPVTDPRGEIAACCDVRDQWLPLATVANGLSAVEMVAAHYGWSRGELEEAAATAEPGAGGLLFLPYFEPERVPALPEGNGLFRGITGENFTRANVARATMEGVALSVGYAMGRLRELGVEPVDLRLTGEPADSPLWRQLVADVTGVMTAPVKRSGGPAMGAVIQAGVVYFQQNGEDLSYEEFAAYVAERDEEAIALPDPGRQALYEEMISRQQYLVDTLHPTGFL